MACCLVGSLTGCTRSSARVSKLSAFAPRTVALQGYVVCKRRPLTQDQGLGQVQEGDVFGVPEIAPEVLVDKELGDVDALLGRLIHVDLVGASYHPELVVFILVIKYMTCKIRKGE